MELRLGTSGRKCLDPRLLIWYPDILLVLLISTNRILGQRLKLFAVLEIRQEYEQV